MTTTQQNPYVTIEKPDTWDSNQLNFEPSIPPNRERNPSHLLREPGILELVLLVVENNGLEVGKGKVVEVEQIVQPHNGVVGDLPLRRPAKSTEIT